MKYDRFEQLPVWQAAMTLAEKVYLLSDHRPFARLRELKDQLRRAFTAQRSTEAFMHKLRDIRNAAEKPNTIHEPS